jgi:uncharacterized membrane protein
MKLRTIAGLLAVLDAVVLVLLILGAAGVDIPFLGGTYGVSRFAPVVISLIALIGLVIVDRRQEKKKQQKAREEAKGPEQK